MTNQQQTWVDGAGKLVEILETNGDPARANLVRLIQSRLALPQAYVTVVGETSSGKSSLINALLENEVLPTGAEPTTGIVTHVACRNEASPRYLAIYRDATQEEITHDRFCELSADPDDDLLRLQLRAAPKAAAHVGLHVFDTPGYNAVISKHEEILMAFLPQSDVIVFVVGYKTGFGQADQDLFEAVSVATGRDSNIPVILVVNRAPQGCHAGERRVTEIMRLARDGLKRDMSLQIVGSTNQPVTANTPMLRRRLAAAPLWDEVYSRAFDPAVLRDVQVRLERALLAVVNEVDAALEREEAGLVASPDELAAMQATIDLAEKAKSESLHEVDCTINALQTALPRLIEKLTSAAEVEIAGEIEASETWLGYSDCAESLAAHRLPFEIRGIGRKVEEHLAIEMEALNRRLEEIANTAIAEIDRTVTLHDGDSVGQFLLSVSTTLGQRLAGNMIDGVLRGLGGVGGAAAGAGNLAKMAVSRTGRLFGKVFGREVYDQIGRIFTKKMLERLNVALMVVVELVTFTYEAQTWKDKLIEKSRIAVQEWKDATLNDLHAEQLPRIRQANRDVIAALYDDLKLQAAPDADRGARLAEVRELRARVAALRKRLSEITA